jgi:hypothetical protein
VAEQALGKRVRHDDMGEDVGVGPQLAQRFEDLFTASHPDQPIMNDCYFHARIPIMVPAKSIWWILSVPTEGGRRISRRYAPSTPPERS